MSSVDAGWALYRDWWAVATLFGVFAALGVVSATETFGIESAAQWGIVTAGIGTVQLVYVRRHLPLNHPLDRPSEPHPRLGAANLVTVVRGGLFAALAGFAVVPPDPTVAWLPALCYGAGVTLDYLDGVIARAVDQPTLLGSKLDMAFDTLGFTIAPVVGVLWGRLPVWYLSLAAARYVFKLACWQRERRGRPVDDLPPSRTRRTLAGIQMAFLPLALAPILPADTVAAIAPFVLLPSLAYFARDYLVVTRRL